MKGEFFYPATSNPPAQALPKGIISPQRKLRYIYGNIFLNGLIHILP